LHPGFDTLTQVSMWLSINGQGEAWLMHKALAEVYGTWDEMLPSDSRKNWIYKILARRSIDGLLKRARPRAPASGNMVDIKLSENRRFRFGQIIKRRQKSVPTKKSRKDADYYKSIAGLPAVFRYAMTLSYLEGFSNKKIADLVGVKPQAIESLLKRGRGILRERLLAQLVGDGGTDTALILETSK